MIDSLEV